MAKWSTPLLSAARKSPFRSSACLPAFTSWRRGTLTPPYGLSNAVSVTVIGEADTFSTASWNGTYVFSMEGYIGNSSLTVPVTIAGRLVVDGKGKITSGTMDYLVSRRACPFRSHRDLLDRQDRPWPGPGQHFIENVFFSVCCIVRIPGDGSTQHLPRLGSDRCHVRRDRKAGNGGRFPPPETMSFRCRV